MPRREQYTLRRRCSVTCRNRKPLRINSRTRAFVWTIKALTKWMQTRRKYERGTSSCSWIIQIWAIKPKENITEQTSIMYIILMRGKYHNDLNFIFTWLSVSTLPIDIITTLYGHNNENKRRERYYYSSYTSVWIKMKIKQIYIYIYLRRAGTIYFEGKFSTIISVPRNKKLFNAYTYVKLCMKMCTFKSIFIRIWDSV